MPSQKCCCLSSDNPWRVTKLDIFHSLMSYREENCRTTSFWKNHGLKSVWDTKSILSTNHSAIKPSSLHPSLYLYWNWEQFLKRLFTLAPFSGSTKELELGEAEENKWELGGRDWLGTGAHNPWGSLFGSSLGEETHAQTFLWQSQ